MRGLIPARVSEVDPLMYLHNGINNISPGAVEGLGSSSASQQGALSVGSHSSVSSLGFRDGFWCL